MDVIVSVWLVLRDPTSSSNNSYRRHSYPVCIYGRHGAFWTRQPRQPDTHGPHSLPTKNPHSNQTLASLSALPLVASLTLSTRSSLDVELSGGNTGLDIEDDPIDWDAFVREVEAHDVVQLALCIALKRRRVDTCGCLGLALSRVPSS